MQDYDFSTPYGDRRQEIVFIGAGEPPHPPNRVLLLSCCAIACRAALVFWIQAEVLHDLLHAIVEDSRP